MAGKNRIGIIGGGAAGIAAAITAARNDRHAEVFILEQKEKIGRKILATGNGRCNLTNRQIDASCADSCYHGENPVFISKVLKKFGYQDTLDFFVSLGLVTKARGDYIYPRSDQASTVLTLLELELKHLGVAVYCETKTLSIIPEKKGFCIETEVTCNSAAKNLKKNSKAKSQKLQKEKSRHQTFRADHVILACGGKAASSLGSDGSGYQLAKSLGHKIAPVVPALVQLKVKDHPLAEASGVRAQARVTALIDGVQAASDTGELQITASGISGIPVFQISRHIALGLYQKKRTEVLLDLLPEYSEKEVWGMLERIVGRRKSLTIGGCLAGVFNQKLIPRILEQAKIPVQTKVSDLNEQQIQMVAEKCKKILLVIQDTNGFENAQVCAGGVRTEEVCPETMESRYMKGLYLVGELLDADGICGGYNLQWAWATGCIAGKAASKPYL